MGAMGFGGRFSPQDKGEIACDIWNKISTQEKEVVVNGLELELKGIDKRESPEYYKGFSMALDKLKKEKKGPSSVRYYGSKGRDLGCGTVRENDPFGYFGFWAILETLSNNRMKFFEQKYNL